MNVQAILLSIQSLVSFVTRNNALGGAWVSLRMKSAVVLPTTLSKEERVVHFTPDSDEPTRERQGEPGGEGGALSLSPTFSHFLSLLSHFSLFLFLSLSFSLSRSISLFFNGSNDIFSKSIMSMKDEGGQERNALSMGG